MNKAFHGYFYCTMGTLPNQTTTGYKALVAILATIRSASVPAILRPICGATHKEER